MHWVDCGPEPQELKAIRSRYTARWVKYYGDGNGSKPGDFLWRRFHVQLRGVFLGLCAYCEECCRGEVEHFRPKSRFPKLVYQWSNWLFVCHDCNHMKGEKWPQGGYVNPCARSQSAWPETFFDFDTLTGEILPKEGIGSSRRQRAMQMIIGLDLNAYHHLKERLGWLSLVSEALLKHSEDDPGREDFLRRVTARSTQLSSATRVKLMQLGWPVDGA